MTTNRKFTLLTHFLSGGICTLVLSLTAAAGPLPISLTTSGSFSSGTGGELTFTPGSFSGAVATGEAVILSDLGRFDMGEPDGTDNFHGDTFTLQVLFAPALGASGPAIFTGTLHGQSSDHSEGKLQIHFNPDDSQLVTYSNTGGSGSFTLTLDDIRGLEAGSAATLTGEISLGETSSAASDPITTPLGSDSSGDGGNTTLAIPEPGSLMLAGAALVLVSLASRRRLFVQ